MDFGTLLVPVSLLLAAPVDLGTYEKGLFCDSPALVEQIVERADRGEDAWLAVTDLNVDLKRIACRYAMEPEIRARTVKFERNVGANHMVYSIYRVDVTAFAPQKTEIGSVVWNLTPPVTMYTLRAATPEHLYDH